MLDRLHAGGWNVGDTVFYVEGGGLVHISWSEIVMQRSRTMGLVAGLLLAGGVLAPRATEQPARPRSEFMRTKLEASSRIIEGLAVEDYELIMRGPGR